MEKVCEFCTASMAVVYCSADGAHLCLTCDAKVHSANTLFSRHLRYLLCDLCNKYPAYFRCFEHRIFMCQGCERNVHNASSQHQNQTISSFMGCPSAMDFAELWGFNLNELARSVPQDQFVRTCGRSADPSGLNENIQEQSNSQVAGLAAASQLNLNRECKVGSSSQQREMHRKHQMKHKNSFILQQLVDLDGLQLSEKNNLSSLLSSQEHDDTMSSTYRTSCILDEKFDQDLQLEDLDSNLQRSDSPTKDLKLGPLSFTQLANFHSFSSLGFPLPGDSFWQCKSPDESSQLWSQNMQDIGVCEEPIFHDNFDIPDVDVTFQNIEEMLDGAADLTKGLPNNEDESCFQVGNKLSLDGADNSCTNNLEGKMDPAFPLRKSLSLSLSRLSAESGATDCLDTGVSAITADGEPSRNPPDLNIEQIDGGAHPMTVHKEKKARFTNKEGKRSTSQVQIYYVL